MNKRDYLAAGAALLLAGCLSPSGETPTLYTSIHSQAFKELKVGVSTKEDVRKQIGIPMTQSHFPRLNEDVWEYRFLEGSSVVMLGYVHFDANGVFKSFDERLDPAFKGGGEGV